MYYVSRWFLVSITGVELPYRNTVNKSLLLLLLLLLSLLLHRDGITRLIFPNF